MSGTIKKSTALSIIALLVIVAVGAGSYNVLLPPQPVTKSITQTETKTVTQTGAVTQTVTQPVTTTVTRPVTQTVTQTVTAKPAASAYQWELQPSPPPPTLPPANKRDGVIIEGYGAVQKNYDPWDVGIWANYLIYANYDTLLMQGADGKMYPSLATKMERPDERTFVLTLRKDVKFHDGTPLTAKDVKATYDRGIKTPLLRSYAVASIQSIDIIDDYTVRFNLKRKDPDFPAQLASHTGIHSAARLAKFGEEIVNQPPMGTGPFKFVEYVPGDRWVNERNEDYWGGKAFLKRHIVRFIREEAVRSLELQKGGVHFYRVGDARFVDELKKAGAQVYQSPPGFFTRDLAWSNMLPWAKDINVRKAINYAIDRKAFIDVLEAGYATPSIGPVPPWMGEAHNPNLGTGYSYDVAKAKELMAKSKYPNGFTVKYLAAGEDDEIAVPIFIANLGAIGIKLEVERVDPTVKSRRNLNFGYEMTQVGWGGSAPTAQGTFELRWHTTQVRANGWNYFHTNATDVGKKIDGILDALFAEDDFEKKKQLFNEFQTTVQENAIYASITYRIIIWVASHQVKGYEVFPRHIFYGQIFHAPQVGVGVWLDPDAPILKK